MQASRAPDLGPLLAIGPLAHDPLDREVPQTARASRDTTTAADSAFESIRTLFAVNVHTNAAALRADAGAIDSSASSAPFGGTIAIVRQLMAAMRTPDATPKVGGRLSVGHLAFDINDVHSSRLARAAGLDDDWRAIAAEGLTGKHARFALARMPQGVLHRNFGNLRDNVNGGFRQFDTFEEGIHAADMNLLDYGVHHHITTITGIVNRWAPAGDGDNNPSAYAASVSRTTGIGADDPIDLKNSAVRHRILAAMFDVESPGWRLAMQQPDTAFAALTNPPPRRKATPFAPAIQPASEAQPEADDV
ncbi:Uncharacterised protein [Burkholderia pseudomallei]|nr:Uncharacterised protein [Burkholderia pseudomallei]VCK72333.1 Uncharacterised protein [Burkholderia pseudomallei]VCK79766.1 Uncharacterised protein [Burkholderia pseudomallei]VCK80240.1 Uncharacterised protein [Burkholderia pseudomallei]VCK80599.1 Uncharacterised protein [Burkholderia pseudomallei]